MTELVFATGNVGKVRELSSLIHDTGIKVIPQTRFACPQVEESGLTFIENALLKARNAARHTGRAALADDSGIAVDALNGAPGIYSARYAGPDASDTDNVACLLHAMREVPQNARACRFICVLVYLAHAADPTPLIAQGIWHGEVATAPRGNLGFGYDPIFWLPQLACTAAELEPARKNELSHRGQALRVLVAQLKTAAAT